MYSEILQQELAEMLILHWDFATGAREKYCIQKDFPTGTHQNIGFAVGLPLNGCIKTGSMQDNPTSGTLFHHLNTTNETCCIIVTTRIVCSESQSGDPKRFAREF